MPHNSHVTAYRIHRAVTITAAVCKWSFLAFVAFIVVLGTICHKFEQFERVRRNHAH